MLDVVNYVRCWGRILCYVYIRQISVNDGMVHPVMVMTWPL